jgi:outer membrane lipopolysaccharide assembly protein LptE/RlpB
MKYKLLKKTFYVTMFITILTGCGGRIYGFRKKVRVKQPLAKSTQQKKTEVPKLEIVTNTLHMISKPVEVKKKPPVKGTGNPNPSAMFR